MNQIVWTMISFVVISLIVFAFWAWLLRGWLVPYLKVKASRGGKLLVKIRGNLEDYYKVGLHDSDGLLNVKFKDKKTYKLDISKSAYYRTLGIVAVDIDEKSKMSIDRDYKINSTFNHELFQDILCQALENPKGMRRNEMIIMVVLILMFLVVLFVAFKVNGLGEQVELLKSGANTVAGVNL